MLNKRIIKNLLNVKHTIIDAVEMTADNSLVVQCSPIKGTPMSLWNLR